MVDDDNEQSKPEDAAAAMSAFQNMITEIAALDKVNKILTDIKWPQIMVIHQAVQYRRFLIQQGFSEELADKLTIDYHKFIFDREIAYIHTRQ